MNITVRIEQNNKVGNPNDLLKKQLPNSSRPDSDKRPLQGLNTHAIIVTETNTCILHISYIHRCTTHRFHFSWLQAEPLQPGEQQDGRHEDREDVGPALAAARVDHGRLLSIGGGAQVWLSDGRFTNNVTKDWWRRLTGHEGWQSIQKQMHGR